MWIVLIHPPIYDFTAYDLWLRPLGLYNIGAYIKKFTPYDVILLDYMDRENSLSPLTRVKKYGTGNFPREKIEKPEPLKSVKRYYYRFGIPRQRMEEYMKGLEPPLAVLITTGMTYWYPGVQEVVESVKNIWGSVPVFIGGTYATLMPEHASKYGNVVPGEVDGRVLEILSQLTGKKFTADHEPLPLFSLSKRKSSVMTTTRGCPYRCSFCASFILHRYSKKSKDRVLSEVEELVRLGVEDVALYDDALLIDADNHFKPIFREIIREKFPIRFHLPNGIHVRFLDEEVAELMAGAGVKNIRLSLESVEDEFLKRSSPKLHLSEFERAVSNLEKAGYRREELVAYVIIGVPGQSASSVEKTLDYLRRMRVRPSLAYYSPVPGTADFELLEKEGYMSLNDDPLLHNKLMFPYLGYSEITEAEFERLRQKAFDIVYTLHQAL